MARELPTQPLMHLPGLRPRARASAALLVAVALAGSLFASSGDAYAQSSRKRTRKTSSSKARVTPASSRAPAGPSWTSPRGTAALTSDISSLISSRVRGGKFGVMIVSLTRGDTLFAQNAGEMMQPASTMKLFSTAVALDRYGPEHSFSTDVLRDGALGADGTVDGSVYLRADGD